VKLSSDVTIISFGVSIMDKTNALQKLLDRTATKKEIELLKQALASGEILIGEDMTHLVVIIGSGN